jgi:hypothetical protein
VTGVTTGGALELGAATQILHAYPADARPTDLTGLIDSGLTWNQSGTGDTGATFQIPLTYGTGTGKTFTTLRPASVTPGDNTANWDQNWVSSHGNVTGTLGQLVSTIEQAGNVSIYGFGVFAEDPTNLTSIQAGTTKYTFADSKQITIAKPTITGQSGEDTTKGERPLVGDVLTAHYAVTSPQSQAGETATYQWYAGSTKLSAPGGTGSTYTVSHLHLGAALSVQVTVSKTGELSTSGTSAITAMVGDGVFSHATVAINGTGAVGTKETAAVTGVPAGTKVTYQWYSGMSKTTTSVHTLTAADLGHVITVRVKLVDAGYTTATVKSTDSVTAILGTLHVTPTITGTAEVGKTLTAHSGSAVSGQTVYYIWYGSSDPVHPLATTTKTATFKIPASLVGEKIAVYTLVVADGYEPNDGDSAVTDTVTK